MGKKKQMIAVPREFFWDEQSAFEAAYAGILLQGSASTTTISCGTICSYRSHNGRKCAIGWLIPDHCYDSILMEGAPVAVLPRFVPHMKNLSFYFMDQLRQAHDMAASYTESFWENNFRENMAALAKEYNLTIPKFFRNG